MSVALLDVNVLIAFAWPSHVHHREARNWMRQHGPGGWATCPMTECGFVRISANPKIVTHAVEPSEAVALLRRMTAMSGHHFWPDDLSLLASSNPAALIMGHRQVTDAYLLSLAATHNGRLVTLDRNLAALAPPRSALEQTLEIICGD